MFDAVAAVPAHAWAIGMGVTLVTLAVVVSLYPSPKTRPLPHWTPPQPWFTSAQVDRILARRGWIANRRRRSAAKTLYRVYPSVASAVANVEIMDSLVATALGDELPPRALEPIGMSPTAGGVVIAVRSLESGYPAQFLIDHADNFSYAFDGEVTITEPVTGIALMHIHYGSTGASDD